MRANVIQVYPFNIDKVKLLTMRGAPGAKGPKGDPGNFQLDQLVPTNSAAGSIASFADGGNDLPVKDLKVNIQPSQDLHGYSNPWPGGATKNVFPYATLSGTGNILLKQPVDIKSGSYIVSCVRDTNTGYFSLVFYDANDTQVGATTLYLSNNNAVALTLSADAKKVTCYAGQQMSVSNVQIESGSSATTYIPYSNICPITGWENVKVTRTGKNIIENQGAATSTYRGVTATKNADGSVTLNGTVTGGPMYYKMAGGYFADAVPIPKWLYGKQLTLSGGTSEVAVMFSTYNASGTVTNRYSTTSPATFTIAEDQKYFGYFLNSSNGRVINNVTIYPQLEVGSSASSYEPYTAAEVTISLGSTVYGGTLDVTTGVLTVDRAMVDLGTLEWTRMQTAESGYYRFLSNDTLTKPNAGNTTVPNYIICSNYKAITPTQSYTLETGITITAGATGGKAYVYDSNYSSSTVQQFASAMSGVALVYELITPTTVQLTPAQLNTLLGVNNIWSDAGDTSVEYYADTKLYIDLAGQTEDDMTANANIASGRYFQIGNTLYISTAAIAAGETIVPGTNCRKTTIAEALNALL